MKKRPYPPKIPVIKRLVFVEYILKKCCKDQSIPITNKKITQNINGR